MNIPDNPDRLRVASTPSPRLARDGAAQRFDEALRREPQGHEGEPGADTDGDTDASGGGDGGGEGDRSNRGHRDPHGLQHAAGRTEPAAHALPPGVLRAFRASLDRHLPPSEPADDLIEALLHDIAEGLRMGAKLPGPRWRLCLRLRPELLPATEVDITGADRSLSVALRTADEDAYRAIVSALPELQRALLAKGPATVDAVAFLVTPKDLQ